MPVAQDAQAGLLADRVGLLEQPLQLLIEILAVMNQVDNDQLARVVHCIGNSVLRLSFSEVKRVEPVGRSGEPLTGEGFTFKILGGLEGGSPHGFRQLPGFLAR
jgi:hypothetical protein